MGPWDMVFVDFARTSEILQQIINEMRYSRFLEISKLPRTEDPRCYIKLGTWLITKESHFISRLWVFVIINYDVIPTFSYTTFSNSSLSSLSSWSLRRELLFVFYRKPHHCRPTDFTYPPDDYYSVQRHTDIIYILYERFIYLLHKMLPYWN